MQIDCIRAIEACYAPAADEAGWLRNVADAIEPLARGLPPAAYTFSIGDDGRFRQRTLFPAIYQGLREVWETADPEVVRIWYSAVPPIVMASRQLRRTPRDLAGHLRPVFEGTGVKDAVGMIALEPDRCGVTITVPYLQPLRLPPRTLHQLGRVTAHLSTAFRLRARARSALAPGGEGVEAVLAPDGRVQHASEVAKDEGSRASLAAAVRAIERARGGLRRTSPEEAVALWQGLVDGRWSLVDHTETDGRRVVLAHRNEPGARDPRTLTARERAVLAFAALGHSNKHIAYLLGLATSTVATHLSSAMLKLGLRSRRDAIAMLPARRGSGATRP